MKRYILILFFFLILPLTNFAQNYWLPVNSPTDFNLKRCYFIDTLRGWVCGDTGIIIKTTNGGQNWTYQNSKTRYFLHDIFFLNERLGWAIGWNIFNPQPPYGTMTLKTTNGGTTWDTTFFSIENVFLRKIYYQDSLTGFLGGNGVNLLKTTNGGANYFACEMDSVIFSGFPVTNFKFYNNNYGYALGGVMDIAGIIWRTTDRGNYWYPKIVAPEPLMGLYFYDSLNALGFGGDFEYGPAMINTTNAGVSWKYQNLGLFGMPLALSFRAPSEGWVSLGYAQKFLLTLDSGTTWTEIATPDSAEVNDIVFVNDRVGYAVAEKGRIFKYNSSLVNYVNNTETVPEKFILHQNYPNPYNPYTNISYELKTNSYVVLKIYDITGRDIRTINQGYQNTGKYNLRFSADGLSSGIYFYEINVRDLTGKSNTFLREIKKMVLIK